MGQRRGGRPRREALPERLGGPRSPARGAPSLRLGPRSERLPGAGKAHPEGVRSVGAGSANRARAERRQIEDKVRLALIGKRMIEGSDGWEQRQARAREETRAARAKAADTRRGDGGRLTSRASREAAQEPMGAFTRCSCGWGGYGKHICNPDPARKAAARLAAEVGVSRATVEQAVTRATGFPRRRRCLAR